MTGAGVGVTGAGVGVGAGIGVTRAGVGDGAGIGVKESDAVASKRENDHSVVNAKTRIITLALGTALNCIHQNNDTVWESAICVTWHGESTFEFEELGLAIIAGSCRRR